MTFLSKDGQSTFHLASPPKNNVCIECSESDDKTGSPCSTTSLVWDVIRIFLNRFELYFMVCMLQMFLTILLQFFLKTWKIARIIRVKVRVFSLHAKQAQREGRDIPLPLPDTGARRGLVCSMTLQLL
jgi:hypothetical protein